MRDSLSLYERHKPHSMLSIISVPTELGSDARGLAGTPQYLRTHGLAAMLETIAAEVAEETTIACTPAPPPGLGALKNLKEVATVAHATASAVTQAASRGDTVLSLGGDHSASIGTLQGAAAAHRSLGVIWIDAHPDVHTHETTETHNPHGMPAALAMGHGHPLLLGKKRRAVAPENFLFLGLKDMDGAEIEFLRRHSPPLFTMLDIAGRGLSPLFAAIEALSKRVDKVWVSMDMDAVDALYAPGVAMPNHGGLTAREALSLAHYIGKTCEVAGVDIVEMLPKNDSGGKTAALALQLTARFLGAEWGSYQTYMEQYCASESALLQ